MKKYIKSIESLSFGIFFINTLRSTVVRDRFAVLMKTSSFSFFFEYSKKSCM